eukprot:133059_1
MKKNARYIFSILIMISLIIFNSNTMLTYYGNRYTISTPITYTSNNDTNINCKMYSKHNQTNYKLLSTKGYGNNIIPQLIFGLNNQKMFFIGLLIYAYKHTNLTHENIIVLPETEISYPLLNQKAFVSFQDIFNLSFLKTTLKNNKFNFTFVNISQLKQCDLIMNSSLIMNIQLVDYHVLQSVFNRARGRGRGNKQRNVVKTLAKVSMLAIKPHQFVLNQVNYLISDMISEKYPFYFALQARIENDMKKIIGPKLTHSLWEILLMINGSFPFEVLQSTKYLFIAVGPDISKNDKQILDNKITPWNGTIIISDNIANRFNYSYQNEAMFDYEICLKAKIFIGWRKSTFSQNVAYDRKYDMTFDYLDGKIKRWNGKRVHSVRSYELMSIL